MLRLFEITNVILKYRLDDYLSTNERTKFLSTGGGLLRKFFYPKPVQGTFAQRFRMALEELGPVFVKFGQILSTRQDMLPPSLVNELNKLKEQVKPYSSVTARRIIEESLGKPIDEVFQDFPRRPQSSASVAQVYYATLKDGKEVAVKVLRPEIREIIKNDISILRNTAQTLEVFRPKMSILRFNDILTEIEESMYCELDLRLEAKNAMEFKEFHKDNEYVFVPEIYEAHENVLIMERMYGIPVDDIDAIKAKGWSTSDVVARGLEMNLLQIFRDGFFHADQHTGNVWISDNGGRVYLDFGIMGRLDKEDKTILAKTLVFLFTKNYKGLAQIQKEAGWFNGDADENVLIDAYKDIANTIVDRTQKEYSVFDSLRNMLNQGEKYGLKVPTRFTLLVKNLIIIEGVSKKVDPNVNIKKLGEPIIMKHFKHWFEKPAS